MGRRLALWLRLLADRIDSWSDGAPLGSAVVPGLLVGLPVEGRPRLAVVGVATEEDARRLADWLVARHADLVEELFRAADRLP